jgi:hypothetical protein
MTTRLLHLVLGGEVTDPQRSELVDLDRLDIVGIFASYALAYEARRAEAQASVDQADVRYFVVHLHRLLDPEATGGGEGSA